MHSAFKERPTGLRRGDQNANQAHRDIKSKTKSRRKPTTTRPPCSLHETIISSSHHARNVLHRPRTGAAGRERNGTPTEYKLDLAWNSTHVYSLLLLYLLLRCKVHRSQCGGRGGEHDENCPIDGAANEAPADMRGNFGRQRLIDVVLTLAPV